MSSRASGGGPGGSVAGGTIDRADRSCPLPYPDNRAGCRESGLISYGEFLCPIGKSGEKCGSRSVARPADRLRCAQRNPSRPDQCDAGGLQPRREHRQEMLQARVMQRSTSGNLTLIHMFALALGGAEVARHLGVMSTRASSLAGRRVPDLYVNRVTSRRAIGPELVERPDVVSAQTSHGFRQHREESLEGPR